MAAALTDQFSYFRCRPCARPAGHVEFAKHNLATPVFQCSQYKSYWNLTILIFKCKVMLKLCLCFIFSVLNFLYWCDSSFILIINKMSQKTISPAQKTILIEFMQENPQMVTQKQSNQFTNADIARLWQKLTTTLNSIPGARKTWKEWRKVSNLK